MTESRYTDERPLATGGMAQTSVATDTTTGEEVVLKRLKVGGVDRWKSLELFEREASVLATLDHPGIPGYVDAFDDEGAFVLVQRRAPGRSLRAWVADGWHADPEALLSIAKQLIEVLQYLQRQSPPIVHRDIKPDNVIRDEDGHVMLVDFGAVQDHAAATLGGSTVVGTIGYMAPEQLRGQAGLTTDLYGIGATLVFLITGTDPADLERDRLRLKWTCPPEVDEPFSRWVDRLVAPFPEDRFANAEQASEALVGGPTDPSEVAWCVALPPMVEGSELVVTRDDAGVSVTVPSPHRDSVDQGTFALIVMGTLIGGVLFATAGPWWLVPALGVLVVAAVRVAVRRGRLASARLELSSRGAHYRVVGNVGGVGGQILRARMVHDGVRRQVAVETDGGLVRVGGGLHPGDLRWLHTAVVAVQAANEGHSQVWIRRALAEGRRGLVEVSEPTSLDRSSESPSEATRSSPRPGSGSDVDPALVAALAETHVSSYITVSNVRPYAEAPMTVGLPMAGLVVLAALAGAWSALILLVFGAIVWFVMARMRVTMVRLDNDILRVLVRIGPHMVVANARCHIEHIRGVAVTRTRGDEGAFGVRVELLPDGPMGGPKIVWIGLGAWGHELLRVYEPILRWLAVRQGRDEAYIAEALEVARSQIAVLDEPPPADGDAIEDVAPPRPDDELVQ